jgi:hypothetical protein
VIYHIEISDDDILAIEVMLIYIEQILRPQAVAIIAEVHAVSGQDAVQLSSFSI